MALIISLHDMTPAFVTTLGQTSRQLYVKVLATHYQRDAQILQIQLEWFRSPEARQNQEPSQQLAHPDILLPLNVRAPADAARIHTEGIVPQSYDPVRQHLQLLFGERAVVESDEPVGEPAH